jgi:hypothetical protein
VIDQLTAKDFSQPDDSELSVRFAEQEQPARVIEVRELSGGAPGSRQPFAITLRSGPVDRHWPQGTYTLIHPRHGEMSLFLVPIGPDSEGMCYEVNFA